MKKFLLIILSFSLIVSCISAKEKKNKKDLIQMEGLIQMYGNEPFSYPGLKTTENKYFSLLSENKKINDKILKNSGHKVLVWGEYESEVSDKSKLGFQKLKDGFFVVKKIKVIK